MKRAPMSRGTSALKRSRVNPRSKKRTAAYAGEDGRAAFVGEALAERPYCEIRVTCEGRPADDVHETITRRRSGAIVPGPLAELQGQRFLATCRQCHDHVHAHRRESEAAGFLDARHGWEIPSE